MEDNKGYKWVKLDRDLTEDDIGKRVKTFDFKVPFLRAVERTGAYPVLDTEGYAYTRAGSFRAGRQSAHSIEFIEEPIEKPEEVSHYSDLFMTAEEVRQWKALNSKQRKLSRFQAIFDKIRNATSACQTSVKLSGVRFDEKATLEDLGFKVAGTTVSWDA